MLLITLVKLGVCMAASPFYQGRFSFEKWACLVMRVRSCVEIANNNHLNGHFFT